VRQRHRRKPSARDGPREIEFEEVGFAIGPDALSCGTVHDGTVCTYAGLMERWAVAPERGGMLVRLELLRIPSGHETPEAPG